LPAKVQLAIPVNYGRILKAKYMEQIEGHFIPSDSRNLDETSSYHREEQ